MELREAGANLRLLLLPLGQRELARVVHRDVLLGDVELGFVLLSLGGHRRELRGGGFSLLLLGLELGNLRGDLFIRRLLSLLQRLLDPVVLGEVNLAVLLEELRRALLPAAGIRLEQLSLAGGALGHRLRLRSLFVGLLDSRRGGRDSLLGVRELCLEPRELGTERAVGFLHHVEVLNLSHEGRVFSLAIRCALRSQSVFELGERRARGVRLRPRRLRLALPP